MRTAATISTPEGVQLALPLAHIGSRFMALAIDLRDRAAALASRSSRWSRPAAGSPAAIVGRVRLLVFYIGYHVVFEVFGGGRTLGKRAAGLRVVTDGGAAVGLRASLIRNILLLLEGLTLFYVPAMISVLATRNNQRLGDHAGGHARGARGRAARRSRRPPLRRSSPSATRPGTSPASARRRPAPCARSWSAAPSCARARAARSPPQLAGRLRPQVAGARPGLDDETFLEYFAAAKARGKLRESPKTR